MWARRALAAASIVVACAACAKVLGVEDVGYGPGGGDAGSHPDGSSSAVDGGPVTRPCSARTSLVFCDDFELGVGIDDAYYQGVTAGKLELDTVRVHGGAHALHAQTFDNPDPGVKPEANLYRNIADGGAVRYARAFFYFSSPVATESVPPQLFVAQDGLTNSSQGMELQVQQDTQGYPRLRSNDYSQSGTGYLVSRNAMPLDRWVCIEWLVDTANHVSQVWIDGTEDTTVHDNDLHLTWTTQFRFGLTFNDVGAQSAHDEWVDDVALDTSRIGCD